MALTDAEIDTLLERFDLTDPGLQRKIVAQLTVKAMFLDDLVNAATDAQTHLLNALAIRVKLTAVNSGRPGEVLPKTERGHRSSERRNTVDTEVKRLALQYLLETADRVAGELGEAVHNQTGPCISDALFHLEERDRRRTPAAVAQEAESF